MSPATIGDTLAHQHREISPHRVVVFGPLDIVLAAMETCHLKSFPISSLSGHRDRDDGADRRHDFDGNNQYWQ